MFIVNTQYGALSTYQTGNLRFDHPSEGHLFQILSQILSQNLDTPAYFKFYKSPIRRGRDSVLTVSVFKKVHRGGLGQSS